jgi:hypothetical protein
MYAVLLIEKSAKFERKQKAQGNWCSCQINYIDLNQGNSRQDEPHLFSV